MRGRPPRPGGDRREEVYAACELLQALGLSLPALLGAAFAATLLVVSLEVPRDFDELLVAEGGLYARVLGVVETILTKQLDCDGALQPARWVRRLAALAALLVNPALGYDVRGIVAQSGGWVRVEAAAGANTVPTALTATIVATTPAAHGRRAAAFAHSAQRRSQ